MQQPQQRRRHSTHSRTGCTVCKIRKLKCDETKPTCTRCSAAGWKCEYVAVETLARRPRSTAQADLPGSNTGTTVYQPSFVISHPPGDRTNFYSFQRASGLEVTSCFAGQTWSSVALQMSYHEPAVRHAVYALGSLLGNMAVLGEEVSSPAGGGPRSSKETYSLEHYNQALSHLQQGVVWTEHSQRTILTLCLCFTWIDLLRDDLDGALKHVQAGANIMQSGHSEGSSELEPCLIDAMKRMYAQAQFHGSPTSDFNVASSEPVHDELKTSVSAFESVDDARIHLDHISATSTALMRRLKRSTGSSRLPAASKSLELSLTASALKAQLQCLHRWRAIWEASSAQTEARNDKRHEAAVCLLDIEYTSLLIALSCLNDSTEASFERKLPEFEQIIDHAERFFELVENFGLFPFSFEAGPIRPLFLVAMKCPQLRLRRRALHLLSRCPSRESLWSRDSIIEIVRWKFDKEASQHCENDCVPVDAIIHNGKIKIGTEDGKMKYFVCFKRGSCNDDILEPIDERMLKPILAMGDMV